METYRVFDYIDVSYEALHTTGREYIIAVGDFPYEMSLKVLNVNKY